MSVQNQSTAAEGSKALSTSAAQVATNVPCIKGVYITNPYDSGIIVAVGRTSGVTMAKGVQLAPGERQFFPVSNVNKLYAIAASGTPTISYVPV